MGRGSLRARSGGLLALPQLCFRLTPAAPGLAEVPPVSWAHVGLLCARQALVHSCVWITFLYAHIIGAAACSHGLSPPRGHEDRPPATATALGGGPRHPHPRLQFWSEAGARV